MVYPLSLPCNSAGDTTHMKSPEPLPSSAHTGRRFLTTHPLFDGNFTLEEGSSDNVLSVHVGSPSLSDSTLHNFEDNSSNYDSCAHLICRQPSSMLNDGGSLWF